MPLIRKLPHKWKRWFVKWKKVIPSSEAGWVVSSRVTAGWGEPAFDNAGRIWPKPCWMSARRKVWIRQWFGRHNHAGSTIRRLWRVSKNTSTLTSHTVAQEDLKCMPIYFNVAFKTCGHHRSRSGNGSDIGRNREGWMADVVPRAVPIAEAMAAH